MGEWETIIEPEEDEGDLTHDSLGRYIGEVFDGYIDERPGSIQVRGPLAKLRKMNFIHKGLPSGHVSELWSRIQARYKVGDIVSHSAICDLMPKIPSPQIGGMMKNLWSNDFVEKMAQGRWGGAKGRRKNKKRGWDYFGVHYRILGNPLERDTTPPGIEYYSMEEIAEAIKPIVREGYDFRKGHRANNYQNVFNLAVLFCLLNTTAPTYAELTKARSEILLDKPVKTDSYSKTTLDRLNAFGLIVFEHHGKEEGRHVPGRVKIPEIERGQKAEFLQLSKVRLLETEKRDVVISGVVKAVAVPDWEVPEALEYKGLWADDIVSWATGRERPNWYDDFWLLRRYGHH